MAAYLFENLGPEKFQQLCQALLIRDFPDLQCFPVGQPDGGRDGLSRGTTDSAPNVVLQVKFRRTDEDESAEWMIAALESELPKVKRLADSGATRYLMITNARPTGHEGGGRIDRVQAWMNDNLPIPGTCYWRDDLERRLDTSDSTVKLAYPAILSGEDALTLIVEALMGQGKERVARSLKAFVAKQYKDDSEVKFRQVDLSNSLLALFVDVPIEVTPFLWEKAGWRLPPVALRAIQESAVWIDDDSPSVSSNSFFQQRLTMNAADLLLHSEIQASIPWVVLEGAPGQGKSTLAQYVCQVHRALFLDKGNFLGQIRDKHALTAFRLPVKVDLRDLAAFLDGRPFLGEDEPHAGTKTLEKFLAALISIQAGGLDFSADDLAETTARLPMLLFLDGLDEVADLKLRKLLIDRILEGLHRLKENGADLQVVVTSRPSLFGKAAEFPKAFVRLTLGHIPPETVTDYASKWTLAKNLPEARAKEVKSILRAKLALGHIRELTRNPMQLTILLGLIDAVGYSLPDVRTDLYREYMALFMTREAEKSPGVRQHRHLLLEIVEYLAWRLQCEAEAEGSSGAISDDELRALVAERLESSQQDTAILDDLFAGGLERVYVLVQRVQGLYEFEVQPLREYFAAKYLYSSAPVGNFRHRDVQGDRAQRFEAIAVNPYWTNVTRFYAGFYEGGEIGALGASLRELITRKNLGIAVNVRSVGAALLTDWVFRSKKFIQNEVVELVFDEIGVELASKSVLPGFVGGVLDKECGRKHLAKQIFDHHIEDQRVKTTPSICGLLRRNGGEALVTEFSTWIVEKDGSARTSRFDVAARCGALRTLTTDAADQLVSSDAPDYSERSERLRRLVQFSHEVLDRNPQLKEDALQAMLDWGGYEPVYGSNEVGVLSWYLAGDLFRREQPLRWTKEAEGTSYATGSLVESTLSRLSDLDTSDGVEDEYTIEARWNEQLSVLKSAFGDRWALYRLAALQVGSLKIPNNIKEIDLAADDTTMLHKAMVGRGWRGRFSWWEERFSSSQGHERLFWLALLLAWSPSRIITRHLIFLNDLLDNLSEDDFTRLVAVLSDARSIQQMRSLRGRGGIVIPGTANERLVYLLLVAIGETQVATTPKNTGNQLIDALLKEYGASRSIASFPGWKELTPRKAKAWVDTFSGAFMSGGDLFHTTEHQLLISRQHMSVHIAETILLNPEKHFPEVVQGAYSAVQQAYKPTPVKQVAAAEGWVFE